MTDERIAPYINFQGRAREAMEFYQGVFGGRLELYASDGQGPPRPASPGDPIMYARLEADEVVIVASDGSPRFPVTAGDNIALSLSGSDRGRLEGLFERLADGGQVKLPLTAMPWGAMAGWLGDRFGVNWNFDVKTG